MLVGCFVAESLTFQVAPLPTRDSISVADIAGSATRSIRSRSLPRHPGDYSDVEGSSPHWIPEHRYAFFDLFCSGRCGLVLTKIEIRRRRRDPPRDPLTVADINGDGQFRSTRVTNPLSPRYTYDIPHDRFYSVSPIIAYRACLIGHAACEVWGQTGAWARSMVPDPVCDIVRSRAPSTR
jgi:hypothetical protein